MGKVTNTPIYLAQFTDREFTTKLKNQTSNLEINKRMDQIVNLFCCLYSRDLFLKQYVRDLGFRLLNKSSFSWEYEEIFI